MAPQGPLSINVVLAEDEKNLDPESAKCSWKVYIERVKKTR